MRLISNLVSQASRRSAPHAAVVYLGRFIFLTAAHFVVARLSMNFALLSGTVSPLWLPAAIALCGCLAWGLRIAPAIWLATFLALLTVGQAWPFAAVIGFGSALEACVAVYLLQRVYRSPSRFIYQETVFRFIGIAVVSSMIGASLGIFAMRFTDPAVTANPVFAWLTWWIGNASGMIIGAPLILAWDIRQGIQWRAAKVFEAVSLMALLPAVMQLAFGGQFGNWPVAYLSIPFFLWAAYRFNLSAVAWTTAITCTIAGWNTTLGHGPFASNDLSDSLLLLMIYISVIGSMGLVLANLVHQHNNAERQLTEERDSLELHVQRRTEALLANIEERKRIEEQLEEAQQLAQIGSWSRDVASGSVIWSNQLYRILGVDRENLEVDPPDFRPFIHEDDLPMLNRAIEEFHMTGKPFHIEYRIRPAGREERIAAARGQQVPAEVGLLHPHRRVLELGLA